MCRMGFVTEGVASPILFGVYMDKLLNGLAVLMGNISAELQDMQVTLDNSTSPGCKK